MGKSIGAAFAFAALALAGGVSLVAHDPAQRSTAQIETRVITANTTAPAKQQPARTADNNAAAITRRDEAERLARATRIGRKIKNRAGGERAHRQWRKRRSSGRAA
jgi:hypothetical protein